MRITTVENRTGARGQARSLPKKWRLKGCVRCAGDMSREDSYGEYVCLQCGAFDQFAPDPALLADLAKERGQRLDNVS